MGTTDAWESITVSSRSIQARNKHANDSLSSKRIQSVIEKLQEYSFQEELNISGKKRFILTNVQKNKQ